MSHCQSFAPVYAADARVLIVGSMPGVASLQAQQYYAHPRNAFWPILCALWGQAVPVDYAARLRFLKERGVALWDVAEQCRREGSLDTRMKEVIPNDFAALFTAAPGIRQVFCNGGTAHALYTRLVARQQPNLPVTRLPSTSPALTLPFDQKLAAWQAVKEALSCST